MRSFLLLLLLSAGLAAKAQNQLEGTWRPVSQEFGGKPLPAAAFKDQTLVMQDSTYVVTAENIDKGVVKTNGNKLDIYGREGANKGKHFTAIYKLENGQLTVCYNLAGDAYPDAFTTQGHPLYFLSVFKKD